MRIGMIEKKMTPPAKVTLAGQFGVRISEYVESDVCVNVFAAENDGEQMILCALDVCSIPVRYADLLREKLKQRSTEIDADRVVFSATHTHTAPGLMQVKNALWAAADFLPEGKVFQSPQETLPEGVWDDNKSGAYMAEIIVDAVCEAWEKRKKAFVAPAFDRCSVGHSRRVMYDGGISRMYGTPDNPTFDTLESASDDGVELLYVFDEEKKPMGVIANVACPAQVVEAQRYVSSDYWGKVRDYVKTVFGKNFVTVGLCSAAGCQSPRDLIRDKKAHPAVEGGRKLPRRADPDMYEIEGAIHIGKRLGRVIADACPTEGMLEEAPIVNRLVKIDLPLRKVTFAVYEAARAQFDSYFEKLDQKEVTTTDLQRNHVHAGILTRFAYQKTHGTVPTTLHVIRFGDIVFASNPFELFLDFGNRIRARSYATQTFLIQLAAGNANGYLPTERAEKGGHYSAYISSGTVGHEGGELLVERTLDEINSMF
ncbi:MAG: hypothetical protein E7390_06860 [Ruminococcaceae bacterium]|nr:hypothetical protein [Oscillospiraceae bacterium]